MKLGGRSRRWAGPVVLAAALTLSGCSSLTPGTASVVDGTKITDAQVDDLVKAQCTAAEDAKKSGQTTTLLVSTLRRRSLGLLMDTELSTKYAATKGVRPEKALTDAIYGQLAASIDQLPASARTVLRDAFEKWAEGRAALVAAAGKASGQTPSPTNIDQLMQEGIKARDAWARTIEVHTDARFSPDAHGLPSQGDGSVSSPVSSFAKDSVASRTDPSWVQQLPASQKCG